MHRKRLMVGLFAAALIAGSGILALFTHSSASASADYSVAPYVDLSADSSGMLDAAISQAGLTSYTAAFIISSGCTPIWGDTLGVDNSTATVKIAKAKSEGASPIISFGGASGSELAQSCTNVTSLTSAYRSVITKYGVDHVDFDIEGAAIADTPSITRRYQAIKALESALPELKVSVTIPVLPSGPDANGSAFLAAATANGARIDLVNAMTMDYGGAVSDMASAAQNAAAGTLSAAQSAGLAVTYANIGITPMIGNNDSAGEVVSETDAKAIVAWAKSNGIGRLAFWSIGRDQPCAGGGVSANCSGLGGSALDFTKIFLQGATGGGLFPAPTSTTASARTTTPAGTTSAPRATTTTTSSTGVTSWVPNHAYRIGDLVTYQGLRYRCIQAHTSLTGWEPPGVPALWQPVPGTAATTTTAPRTTTTTTSRRTNPTRGHRTTTTTRRPSRTTAPATTSSSAPATGSGTTLSVLLTGYGWWDNTPPGSAEISNPVLHSSAGGTGTYADPITVAVPYHCQGSDGSGSCLQWAAGTRFYVPSLQRYLIVEDTCGDGGPDTCPDSTGNHLDVWVGGKSLTHSASDTCEENITGTTTAILKPASGLPVVSGDICR